MDKLQLYITTNLPELQTRLEINADPFVKKWVCDLRETVSQVDYSVAGVSIFYMIKYIDNGFFVVVIRTIPKSPGSHLAAWIFVPYSLRISDKDLMGIVNFITTKVEASEVTSQDVGLIREVFMHDYEDILNPPVFGMSAGLHYAYRYYGPRTGTTIDDLLGKFRYQPCYLNFAGVLLINQDITTNVAGTNLTSAPLEDMAILFPPTQAEVNGYGPTLYGELFDSPTYVPMGRNIDIIWAKEDAPDIKQAIYVAQPEMRAPALTPTATTPIPQREAAREPASPKVAEAPAHTPAQPDASSDRLSVPDRKKVYRFQIPAKSAAIGTVIEFEITTNSDLATSPIDGYEATSDIQEGAGRSNHLFYKAASNIKANWLNNGMYALGGAVIGALLMLLCMSTCSRKAGKEAPAEIIVEAEAVVPATSEDAVPAAAPEAPAAQSTENQAANTEAAPADQVDRSLEAAVKYLDTNQTWAKSEMEAYPDLQGLYNDMNNIERRKLVEVWAPRLKDSRTFTNVARHARLSYKKKARRTPFNSPSESTIRIQAYLNCIDP